MPNSILKATLVLTLLSLCSLRTAQSTPIVANPALGALTLLAHNTVDLNRVDGLTVDRFGNLFAIATGFNKTAGLAFDPFNGDLYIAEQQSQNIWRLQFAPAAVPLPNGAWLLGLGLALLFRHRRIGKPGQPDLSAIAWPCSDDPSQQT